MRFEFRRARAVAAVAVNARRAVANPCLVRVADARVTLHAAIGRRGRLVALLLRFNFRGPALVC